MRKKNGFGLIETIIIMILTALVTSVTTGVIMLNNNTSVEPNNVNITEDEDLLEFIEVYETILSKYYDEVDKSGMLEAAEAGMLDFLGDKYTTYLEDTEYNNIINGLSATYFGIGVEIEGNKIVRVTKNSPADKAGLLVDDLIIKVNNSIVTNLSSDQIGTLIKDDSETVDLVINRDNAQLNFNIKKEKIVNETVEYRVIDNTNIGYIKIDSFSENVDELVSDALKKLENQGIASLIIDVRDNVGGYLSSAETTSSLFMEKGKVIYSLESNNSTYTYKDDTDEQRNYEIVILVNNSTASAAEILASALKESYGATLVGTQTYGKGMVQQMMSLNNGDSMKVSTAKWLTPNGTCINGIGITPDYYIEYVTAQDEQLLKSIELLI